MRPGKRTARPAPRLSLTRRHALAGLASLGGLGLPLRALADVSGSTRRFVFVWCPGGWDPAMVFAPVFTTAVNRDPTDEPATAGGIAYVAADTRPSVTRFFEDWGAKTALVNGWNVPSVAHDVCTRLTLTGTVTGSQDDWISIVANAASEDLPMPNMLLDGPLFPNLYPTASVRLGTSGQLSNLLSGDALALTTTRATAPSAAAQAATTAALRQRLARYAARHATGRGAAVADAAGVALDRVEVLTPYAQDLAYVATDSLSSSVGTIVDGFTLGLARTATLAYGTGGNGDWDTHSDNSLQDTLFEELFDALCALCEGLDAAPGEQGGTLLDETTVVVLSEMGRTPAWNSGGGKDHWPYTTAMFVGSGVRGGQAIGAYNDDLTGQLVDVASGEATDAGEVLYPGHLGATILALADIDPGPWVPESAGRVIDAVLG